VQELARLPGIGEKTATRLAFHLIRSNRQQIRDLAQALLDATDKIRLCSVCMNMTEVDPCPLCTDGRRDPETICVVASPSDLIAIDRGATSRPLPCPPWTPVAARGRRPDDPAGRAGPAVLGGARDHGVREVIIATSPSVDGEAPRCTWRTIKPSGLGIRIDWTFGRRRAEYLISQHRVAGRSGDHVGYKPKLALA
jgi:recombination protein RecR